MAQTFDIRFARSAGLAAMLEVPENAFRWKGGGLLRIDAQGISISVKRGLLALFGGKRMQRIPTESLRAVYREGDALRVEFQSGESARIVLPFWADDRETAEKIVRLLPTSQTVEIEEATHIAKPRADLRVLVSLGVVVAAITLGIWAVNQRSSPTTEAASMPTSEAAALEAPAPVPDTVTTEVEPPASPGPAQKYEAPAPTGSSRAGVTSTPVVLEPPQLPLSTETSEVTGASMPAAVVEFTPYVEASPDTWVVLKSRDGIVPIARGGYSHNVAREELDTFRNESRILRGYYLDIRIAPTVRRLQEIEELWWAVTIRVGNRAFHGSQGLMALQEIELAVSRAWRRALSLHADGLRASNQALIENAIAEIEFAEMLEKRASLLVQ